MFKCTVLKRNVARSTAKKDGRATLPSPRPHEGDNPMNAHSRRLLQALYRATHGDPLDSAPLIVVSGWAKLPHLGVAREAAILLKAAALIHLERSTVLEENRLRLTEAGVAEAARLNLPFWKRWASDKDLVQKLVLLAVAAVFSFVGSVAGRLMLP
jgi:hypothetical protein